MKEGKSDPEQVKPGIQETGIPLLLLNLPQETFQEVQKIAQAGTPGVTTTRIPEPEAKPPQLANLCRETEVEAGFVCKKCRMAYQSEAGLLSHQRNICYPGKLSESRGSVRLVSVSYECKFCVPTYSTGSLSEFKRHCETDMHLCKVRLPKPGFPQQTPQSPSSGLTHEMENVVNQITALAAQAAQESTTPPGQDSNANFTLKNSCQQEPAKMGLVNSHVPVHSLGH